MNVTPVVSSLKGGGKGQCFADETGNVDAQQATARCVARYATKGAID